MQPLQVPKLRLRLYPTFSALQLARLFAPMAKHFHTHNDLATAGFPLKPIVSGYLRKKRDQGTLSWDSSLCRYTLVILVAALVRRTGKVTIAQAIREATALTWNDVEMRLPPNSTNILDIQAKFILRSEETDRPGTVNALIFKIQNSVICPVKALLVVALRIGITYGTTVADVINDALENNNGLIRWKDKVMYRLAVPNLKKSGTPTSDAAPAPKIQKKRIKEVLNASDVEEQVITKKEFDIGVLEDRFLEAKFFIEYFSRINIYNTADASSTQTGGSRDPCSYMLHFCPNKEFGCRYQSYRPGSINAHSVYCRYSKNFQPSPRKPGFFKCPEDGCGRAFVHVESLGFHLKNNHKKWIPRTCPDENCSTEVFETYYQYTKHRETIHGAWRPHRCLYPGCHYPRIFTSRVGLRLHLTTHHGLRKKTEFAEYLYPDDILAVRE